MNNIKIKCMFSKICSYTQTHKKSDYFFREVGKSIKSPEKKTHTHTKSDYFFKGYEAREG